MSPYTLLVFFENSKIQDIDGFTSFNEMDFGKEYSALDEPNTPLSFHNFDKETIVIAVLVCN
jgi:hypothetical protein